MENVKFYNGSGQAIELALTKVKPRDMVVIQKDQVTPQTIQAHGEAIAIANIDGVAIHVGAKINPQYLIRQFGWQVGGVAPYRAPSRANRLQEKQDGFDASIVRNAVEAEKALEEAVTDTGTTRAKVERLTKDTAKKAAQNVVAAAVAADRADGQGAEPPQMPQEEPKEVETSPEPEGEPEEPQTPQETSEPAGPTSETQEGGEASEGGEEAGSQGTEGAPETPTESESGGGKKGAKKSGKGKKAAKKKGGKKKSS